MQITTTQVPVRPLSQDIDKRMKGPQRHRLLQGYPMPPLMKPYRAERPFHPVKRDGTRPLIVGILPHASCTPAVAGCGYCTFPHEKYRASEVRHTVDCVVEEVKRWSDDERQVPALYFGGGTANLTPADAFAALCRQAADTFKLEGAEVTLEGAPVYFTSRDSAILEAMTANLPTRRLRLSMGVQTFDLRQLERMGRQGIGSPEQVERAVREAKKRGMTTSADLMINLPGQTLEEMKSDLLRASELGFDQVCIYHLVLFRGLGTPWSRDRDLMKSVPDNERAFANWLEVTALARELGFVQKTLTNFERSGHYLYEECSYQPERFDGVGFGPAALSCFTDAESRTAAKWMNATSSGEYREAVEAYGDARKRLFVYGVRDLKILHLTRTLPRLKVDLETYQRRFGSSLAQDFGAELKALSGAGLIRLSRKTLQLTLKGMFFADTVAGVLAKQRVSELRSAFPGSNDPPVFRMG